MTKKSDKVMIPGLTEKVIIYTRVSSRKQVETGNGLESQEQCCREWIRNQGGKVELVSVFSDGGVSGKYISRQGLDDMIEYLKEENKEYTKISRVIIDDIDRIIRDVAGWREIKAKIENLGGAKIFSLKQDINDTPEGKMLQSITMSVKQYERENNGRRTKDRQRGRLLNGYWCFNPLPGYKFEFEDELNKRGGRVLVLSEPNASIIKEGFELFAKGILMTIIDFITFLDKKGFTTINGGKLKKNSDIDRVFEKNHLLFYSGYINFTKRDVPMLKGKHPPIIDEDTMNKILDRLNPIRYKARLVNSKEKNMEELPLRGSICCEQCEKQMTGAPSKSKSGKYFFYYTCRNKLCERYGKSINNKEIHTHFEEHLDKMRIQDHRLGLFEDVLNDIWNNQRESLRNIEDDKEKRITLLKKEIEKVQERIFTTDQESLIKMYEERLVGLSTEIEHLEYELSSNDQTKIDLPYIITNTKPILANPLLVRHIPDQKLKRMILSLVFHNQILYNKKNGIQTPQIPLIYTLLSSFLSNEVLDQDRQDLNSRRGALETPALPLSYGPMSRG